ncbi:RNase A-like domain-containing protein [Nocardioides koreensis]
MAGDDSTSQEFARAYDEGARVAVASLADLVESFTGLGHLTAASLANHTRAELRSIVGGAGVYEGGCLPDVGDDSGYVSVLPLAPPTSLGADSPVLPNKVGWILDHIEGFVWPSADVDRLRAAESSWVEAAAGLDDLFTCCDSAIRGFWGERSPEIPLAIDATQELRSSIRALGDQLASLGAACRTYADHVETKRAEIIDLAEWLLEQVVEGVLISVAIGAVTGGAGTAAGLSAVAARVAAESPRFAAILEALRALAAGIAASVRAAREALQATRVTLTKFRDAAVARTVARGESGTLKLWWERESGWLARHEHSGSHTIDRHVGKTDEELLQRVNENPRPKFISTFPDTETAERGIQTLLRRHRREIEEWLSHGRGPLVPEGDLGFVTGRSASRNSGDVFDVTGVRAVLRKDPSMPEGFRIHTAYPQP